MIFRFLSAAGAALQSVVVDAPVFSIGRGTGCALMLAHADVHFVHATAAVGRDGLTITAADGAVLGPPGAPVTQQLLARRGDSAVIGPYTLTLDDLTQPGGWIVSVRHDGPPAQDKAALAAAHVRAFDTRLPNVRLAGFVLACLILLLFLVGPLLLGARPAHFAGRPDAVAAMDASPSLAVLWNVGAMSRGHASFGAQCGACHRAAFQRVPASACLACHQGIGQHADPATAPAADLRPQRCEACHLEHKGAVMAVRNSQNDCAACHGHLHTTAPETLLADATDFADNHPPFKAALVRDATLRTTMRAAIGDAAAADHGNLRFTHATHLKLAKLRDLAGDAACASCHQRLADGTSYKPVSFDAACQSCHTLQFEPNHPEWRLPHGHPEDVPSRLTGFYAQAALNGETFAAPTTDLFFKPGAPPPPAAPTGRAMVSAQVAATMMSAIARSTCGECHATLVTPNTTPGWTIAAVFVPDRYFPGVKFSHAAHDTSACATCHAARASNGGPTLLLPGISTCRTCHAGEAGAPLRVASGCALCHQFHNDSLPLTPARVVSGSAIRPPPKPWKRCHEHTAPPHPDCRRAVAGASGRRHLGAHPGRRARRDQSRCRRRRRAS